MLLSLEEVRVYHCFCPWSRSEFITLYAFVPGVGQSLLVYALAPGVGQSLLVYALAPGVGQSITVCFAS